MTHAWHDIAVDEPVDQSFPAVIEIPKGSKLKELERFFLDYKTLENKRVEVEDFEGPAEANEAIRAALALYRDCPELRAR